MMMISSSMYRRLLCICIVVSLLTTCRRRRAQAFHVTPCWTRIGLRENKGTSSSSSSSLQHSTSTTRPSSSLSPLQMVSTTSSSSSQLSPSQIEKQIVQLGRRGKTDQALEVYRSIVGTPTLRQWNSAMDACARARPTRFDTCFELFHQGIHLHHLHPNEYSFGALLSACSRARRADFAIQVLQDMKNKYKVEPNAVVYSSAISACARSDPPHVQMALQLLQEAEHINVVGYNAALSACARAGEWQSAVQLLENMTSPNSLVVPDQVTYGTILAACESSQQWQLVLTYAEEMQSRHLPLDGMSLTSCLKACQQLGFAQKALEYLEQMKHLSPGQQERMTQGRHYKGARPVLQGPDSVAYRLAISACARGGAWQDGILLLQEMPCPDVVAYTAAITGCEYAGEWKRAFELLEQMRNSSVQPNQVTMAAVIGACAVASMNLVKSGQEDAANVPKQKALQLLNVMKKDAGVVDPNIVVYNAAIRACGEALDLSSALNLLQEIKQEAQLEPTVVTFGSLMTACERVGNLEAASQVFKQMRNAGMEANEIVYGAAISTCRKAGDPERALLLLRKMIRQELSPNVATFNTVLVAQTEGRQLDKALLVYKWMKSKDYNNIRPNRQTYNILIRGLAANKEPNKAEILIRNMQADGFVPDVDLFTATVTSYEKTGQPLRALGLMESMQKDGYDFYDIQVLDRAFKKAVTLVNVVGRGLSTREREENVGDNLSFDIEKEGGDDETVFMRRRTA